MTKACPVLSPTERRYGAIQDAITAEMLRKVDAAIMEAAERARTELVAVGLEAPPPSSEFLASMAHQHLFCTLCGADPKTFANGRAEVALAIIRNSQNIARHYWGAGTADRPLP